MEEKIRGRSVPVSAVADVLLIDSEATTENETIPLDGDAVAHTHAFRASLPAKVRTGLAAAMRAAGRRRDAAK